MFSKSQIIITGSSKGLGKALAEQFLAKGASVLGISRTASIDHPNYQHLHLDLSNIEDLKSFELELGSEQENYILLNNAGTLGKVDHFENLDSDDLIMATKLNFLAPMLLTQKFIRAKCNENCLKYVINIGTGAADQAIDGWSLYCSTKAGLAMFTKVVHQELKMNQKPIKIVDLAPGIIDTEMQAEIRNTKKQQFSNRQRFVDYYENGDLQTADETAALIIRNFNSLFNEEKPSNSVRNFK